MLVRGRPVIFVFELSSHDALRNFVCSFLYHVPPPTQVVISKAIYIPYSFLLLGIFLCVYARLLSAVYRISPGRYI